MCSKWHSLICPSSQLSLDLVLGSGQSFRWKKNTSGEWLGVVKGQVWRLKQDDACLMYQVYGPDKLNLNKDNKMSDDKKTIIKKEILTDDPKPRKAGKRKQTEQKNNVSTETKILKLEVLKNDGVKNIKQENVFSNNGNGDSLTSDLILKDYFQLQVDLVKLYSLWSSQDEHFKKVAGTFTGVRVLRQDPVENLLSFVCSSNNHISRISSMVEKLCSNYGDFITKVDDIDYFTFPPLSALTGDNVETELRGLGFGYRAKFIAKIAHQVCHEKDPQWLNSLRSGTYDNAKKELMTLLGVGAKVADCVCLMSMDKVEALPVDTHVWQFTARHYMTSLNQAKSLTDRIYNQIGDHYRTIWSPYAGWAHAVLFAADLKQNQKKPSGDSKQDKKGRVQSAKEGKSKKSKILKVDVKLESKIIDCDSKNLTKPKRKKKV